jgi:kumamolisin
MSQKVTLSGSHRLFPAKSMPAGKAVSDEISQLTLLLRRRSPAPEPLAHHLSHAELAETCGADPADIRAVEEFAAEHSFSILKTHVGARTVTLAGPLSALAHVFDADIELRLLDNRIFRTRQGDLKLPPSLQDRVIAVFGFDQRPAAETNHYLHAELGQSSYTPPELAACYNFPKNTGENQTIAIIELGGGYNLADLTTYWHSLGLPQVSVTPVSVDGAVNAPTGDPDGPDGEVVLDIEVVGAIAPGANIAVYFAPNTDQGFFNAIVAAVHDAERKPSVISISWGSAECEWTAQSMFAFHAAFHDAALLGITVLSAAGDNGSTDGETSGKHVDFPSSSPWVVSCGGTRLVAASGKIYSETVWNDGTNGGATGGGVSGFFSRPAYQAASHVPAPPAASANKTGRGVPDVAAVADPETGYSIFIDGQATVIGGTSAVAPLWAGLFALCNQQLQRNIGWPHDLLYGTVAQHKILHDITVGKNGSYSATAGWDCCTGLGTPNGQALLDLLAK